MIIIKNDRELIGAEKIALIEENNNLFNQELIDRNALIAERNAQLRGLKNEIEESRNTRRQEKDRALQYTREPLVLKTSFELPIIWKNSYSRKSQNKRFFVSF